MNLRIDDLFFVDFDALIGYSNITNPKLLQTYDRGTMEYSDLAMVFGVGVGYRFPGNPLLIRLAYGLHSPLNNGGLNGALNIQLGVRF